LWTAGVVATMTSFDPAYFRAQGWWRDETRRDWLERHRAADRVAVRTFDDTLSYADFAARVKAFAGALADAGIARGDVVAVHLPNIPEFLIAWLAINELGAIMQTLHVPYGVREIEHLLAHSGAKACLALAKLRERSPAADIASLRGRVPSLRLVIAVGGDVAGTDSFAALMQRGATSACDEKGGWQPTPIQASDPFMQLYTSGTTSSPKAVRVTFNHFLSNARMCAAELGITSEDRILCLAPYTHLYGLYTVQLGLATGATTCLLDLFTPPGFVRALEAFRPTILFAGPAHVAPCLQQNLFQGVDFSGLRVAVVTGSTVPASLSAAFEALLPDGKVLQAWGMTELQFGACSRPSDAREIRFETIGRATPGTELRVADADGRVLPHGETGELQVRGCSLFSGYEKNEEINTSSFTDDRWFRTGDLASMDAQGNVRLRGRTKELINRGGIKFNPIDMEIAIAGHPAVAQVAIAPLPDEVLTERAACFVILKPGASLSFDELKSFLAERQFAKFTWPEHLAIVADMPMTPTRKVMKADLVQQYLAANAGRA
jgi:cyclohexanecarboxylate-CoA ligase/acyl-CoA synthetase